MTGERINLADTEAGANGIYGPNGREGSILRNEPYRTLRWGKVCSTQRQRGAGGGPTEDDNEWGDGGLGCWGG